MPKQESYFDPDKVRESEVVIFKTHRSSEAEWLLKRMKTWEGRKIEVVDSGLTSLHPRETTTVFIHLKEAELVEEIKAHLAVRGSTNSRFTEQWVNELEAICGLPLHDPELNRFMKSPEGQEFRLPHRRQTP